LIGASLPPFLNLNVILSLFFIGLITLGNLRGIRESGTIFAVPTYLFIVSLSVMLVIGLFKAFTGTLHASVPPPMLAATEPITLWLVLRAFFRGRSRDERHGSHFEWGARVSETGIQECSNHFNRDGNSPGNLFSGCIVPCDEHGLVPGDQTIISQIAVAVFGTTLPYYIFQIATTGVLVIAGNTAFADFPGSRRFWRATTICPTSSSSRRPTGFFNRDCGARAIASLLVIIFGGRSTA